MSEGELHGRLVRELTRYMLSVGPAEHLIVAADAQSGEGWLRPPAVSSFRPDVFIRRRDTDWVWLGEAKSTRDVDTRHTRAQLASYFEYLSSSKGGALVVAVPMQSAGEAHRVVRSTRAETGCTVVPFTVTGWVLGPQSQVRTWHG
jgi:hypothetical protein